MKRNFFAVITIFAVTLSAVMFSFAQTKTSKPVSQANNLAVMLPKSDGVAVIDMKRLTQDAIPQILSSNVPLLGEINGHLEAVKNQTGIDLRQFEQVAVGMNFKQTETKKITFEPVVLARGKVDIKNLLAMAQTAAADKVREEKVGDKTVYVFRLKEIIEANRPATAGPNGTDDKMINRIPAEIAATAFDNQTLAIGTLDKVNEVVAGSSHVSSELLSLANRQPNGIMNFAANVPAGISQLWNLEQDELGKTIDSIKLIYGTMDMVNTNTTVSLAAKTYKPEQAKDLEDTLVGLQMVGKGLLGGMQGNDKQIYAKILETAKIARTADQVTINLQVANSDINTLLGKK